MGLDNPPGLIYNSNWALKNIFQVSSLDGLVVDMMGIFNKLHDWVIDERDQKAVCEIFRSPPEIANSEEITESIIKT